MQTFTGVKRLSQALAFGLTFFLFQVHAQNMNITLRSNLTYSYALSNIGGFVDSLNNEYALVGHYEGLDVVNVTNPDSVYIQFTVPGPSSQWREVKTWEGFAYITTEGGGGLTVADLRELPDTVIYHNWTGNNAINGQLDNIHALHIEDGIAYLYGSNLFNGGAVMADLTDPWNPDYVGKYDNFGYIHDGYVRNDTIYAGHIYTGYFTVADLTDPTNPVVLGQQYTPGLFTHNTWLNDAGNVCFSTDEVDSSYVTAYDISDLSNIVELDRIQSNPGAGSIGHNTHYMNDYVVTSWYKDGITIVDVSHPDNMIQTGNFDSYLQGSGPGFAGCWGVYPYLPSGTIVLSDMNNGLYVLTPDYVRGCYLEGVVTDTLTNALLSGVDVQIVSANTGDLSDGVGIYKTGTGVAGTYTVTFSKFGYISKTITGVSLTNGVLTALDAQLMPLASYSVQVLVRDANTLQPIQNADLMISDPSVQFLLQTDGNGNASTNVLPNPYTFTVGKWGYITKDTVASISAAQSLIIDLMPGYYDDFFFDNNWTVSSTSSSGVWERGEPVGTQFQNQDFQTELDMQNDFGVSCYVTGNGSTNASQDDVDNGYTTLTSPVFDVSTMTNAYVVFNRWFMNDGGSGNPNDSMWVYLDNGITTTLIRAVSANQAQPQWVYDSVDVASYIMPTSNMHIIFTVQDFTPGHLVEGGVDRFLVTGDTLVGMSANVTSGHYAFAFPNTFANGFTFNYASDASDLTFSLTDLNGKVVFTKALENPKGSIAVPAAELSSGMYFGTLKSGNETLRALKLVKQ